MQISNSVVCKFVLGIKHRKPTLVVEHAFLLMGFSSCWAQLHVTKLSKRWTAGMDCLPFKYMLYTCHSLSVMNI